MNSINPFRDIQYNSKTYLAEFGLDALGLSLNLHEGMMHSVLGHYRALHRQVQYGGVSNDITPATGDEGFGLQGWRRRI